MQERYPGRPAGSVVNTDRRLRSRQHASVRYFRELHTPKDRRETGLYLLEGVHLVDEALKRGVPLVKVMWSPRLLERPNGPALLARLRGAGVEMIEADDSILDYVVTTETSQGVVASVPQPRYTVNDILIQGGFSVLLDGVTDPGNMGTIMRTAAAAGTSGVLYLGTTTDPFSPKCVRATAGAVLWHPICRVGDETMLARTKLLAASSHEGTDYSDKSLKTLCKDTVTLAIGSEAQGLSEAIETRLAARVHIPMHANVESLNAAAASAILIYHIRSLRAR